MKPHIASLPWLAAAAAAAFLMPAFIPPVSGAESKPTPAPSPSTSRASAVPESERDRKNPVPDVPAAVQSGKELFATQCAMCHGARADGRGDLARDLKLSVPDLTDPERQKTRTDGEWFYLISHGHRDMPPEKRLPDQNKWEIVRYLRTLVKAAPAK